MDRNARMMEMRDSMTLQQIANEFGISRERVRQITGNRGKEVIDSIRNSRKEFILKHPELTTPQLAGITGYSKNTISTIRAGSRHAILDGALQKGTDIEYRVSDALNQNGISHKLMGHFCPYDIELDNGNKIDVKSAYSTINPPSNIGYPYYNFNIKKTGYCDFFIFVVVPEDRFYIVPAHDVKPSNHITTGTAKTSKWQKYLEKWELLK